METQILTLRGRRELSGGCHVLEVDGPIAETLPGQFYMLQTVEGWPVMLPRPFSLYDRGDGGAWGSFLLRDVGPGTHALCTAPVGAELRVTGPLGRCFSGEIEDPICVAGGIGLAPFLLLARQAVAAERKPVRLLFGGRSREMLAGIEDFEGIARVTAATDDGSFGHHGLVTSLMETMLADGRIREGETVFCCGPDPMMEAVAALCRDRGLVCYVSLETYMACGYGVCNGCTVEVCGERFGDWPYSKTCFDGPVYRADELVGFR